MAEICSTVVVIDARSRAQRVFTASVTRLEGTPGIVLRKGVEVGTVHALHGQTLPYPIVVVGEYAAQSSAGFVSQMGIEHTSGAYWIGGAGFGVETCADDGAVVRRGYGLRPFGWPLKVTLIPAGAKVARVETHSNSNVATADAAFAGLQLMAASNPCLFVLAEGQSDYVSATSFELPERSDVPTFPDEHRLDIFSPEKIVDAALRRAAKGNEGRKALLYAMSRACSRVPEEHGFGIGIPEAVFEILSDEEIEKAVADKAAAYEASGWKFGVDHSMVNHFSRVVSPDGAVTDGFSLYGYPELEDMFLELGTLNSEAEKRDIRTASLAVQLVPYFWSEWAVKSYEFGFNDTACGFVVQAEFADGAPAERIWFARKGVASPEGEVNENGSRFLSAFDARGQHLWNRLLEVETLTVTAYEGCEVKAERVWQAPEGRKSRTAPLDEWEAVILADYEAEQAAARAAAETQLEG